MFGRWTWARAWMVRARVGWRRRRVLAGGGVVVVVAALGAGWGSSSPSVQAAVTRSDASREVVGDFNGDGRSDIALLDSTVWSSIPVELSRGDGTFTYTDKPAPKLASRAMTPFTNVVTGDFNGDR